MNSCAAMDELLRRDGEDASDAQHEATRMSTTIEKAELLRRTDLFGRLRTEDQAVVAALTDEREFAADETIFREGDAGTELLIVVHGRVEARRGGNPLFSAGAGGTVGNLALLDGLARDYDAVATEPTRVLLLSRESFYHLLEERFQLVRDVLSHISRVVRRLNRKAVRSQ